MSDREMPVPDADGPEEFGPDPDPGPEPAYDFSNWICDFYIPDVLTAAIEAHVRENLHAAFTQFADGEWKTDTGAETNCGQLLEWISEPYETEQPAWIKFTPIDLARALINDLRDNRNCDPRDMLEIGIPLWRQAIDAVEDECRRAVLGGV